MGRGLRDSDTRQCVLFEFKRRDRHGERGPEVFRTSCQRVEVGSGAVVAALVLAKVSAAK
jgi:hypothetical protein